MISKIQIPDIIAFDITPIDKELSEDILGYYLVSTATIYVEHTPSEPDRKVVKEEFNKIASHLINSDAPQ